MIYINMHKIIKCNNKLKVLGWHLLLHMNNSCQTTMECSTIGTFAENRTGTFLLEMNTPEYVIPWDCLLLQTASIITGFYSQKKTYHQKNNIVPVRRYNRLLKILDKPPIGGHSLSAAEIYSINSNWSWWSMEASLLFTTYQAHWCA